MTVFAIFVRDKKIIVIEEADLSNFNPTGAVFLKAVQVKRMGPRILKKIMEKKKLKL